MEGCVLSSMQGQGCTIIQPAGDGLRVNRVLYCSAHSLMLECNTAEKILLIGITCFFLIYHKHARNQLGAWICHVCAERQASLQWI